MTHVTPEQRELLDHRYKPAYDNKTLDSERIMREASSYKNPLTSLTSMLLGMTSWSIEHFGTESREQYEAFIEATGPFRRQESGDSKPVFDACLKVLAEQYDLRLAVVASDREHLEAVSKRQRAEDEEKKREAREEARRRDILRRMNAGDPEAWIEWQEELRKYEETKKNDDPSS